MNKIYFSIIALLFLLISCNIDREKEDFKNLTNDPSVSLIIQNINIIDVTDGNILPNKTIFIKGDSIFKITETYQIESNVDSLKFIEGTSKYIIPGLWDMHVHTRGKGSFKEMEIPRYIAHGITGVREMMGAPMDLKWKDSINQGTLVGPKMHVGQYVNGYSVYANSSFELLISNKEEAYTKIDSLYNLGYDFIKVYDNLQENVYKAIIEKATELGLEVSGHIPLTVKTEDAIQLGQKTIEHNVGIELGSTYQEDSLRNVYNKQLLKIDSTYTFEQDFGIFRRAEVDALGSIDLKKRDALFSSLVEKEIWVVPTFIYQYLVSYPTFESLLNSPEMQYIPNFDTNFKEHKGELNPKGELEATINYRLSYLKEMHDSGVGILAGTDTPFGFFLHHELYLFVENGLTPLQALQTATINPAKYLNLTESLGTVEEGKIADLVILKENPLDDIHNINDIDAVLLNGKLFNREKLDKMLSDVRKKVE